MSCVHVCVYIIHVYMCTYIMCSMQLESSFLSDERYRGKLLTIMTEVFEKLNKFGLCTINIGT